MNKVVAILGIIVLITLGGLFFCAGFFTGTTIFPHSSGGSKDEAATSAGDGISMDAVEAAVDTKSSSMSEKIMAILSSAAETASSSISGQKDLQAYGEETQVSIDSLLREIASSHAIDDDCSPLKTQAKMHSPSPINSNGLTGKRIVFIGYFKNKIALEIQTLLAGKGYRVHVEHSRTGENESYVFCGPFKKARTAKTLVTWLRKHSFSEARIVNVSSEAIEETLYDALNDDAGPPENVERDIPEMHLLSVNPTPLPAPPIVVPQTASRIPPGNL
ncbi:MAG: hypothetical protein LBG20_01800 [Holosporaceae bacterium]|jgi:hypothetical protein|nr:hypothetical protein [Holosporaceae bacterium]